MQSANTQTHMWVHSMTKDQLVLFFIILIASINTELFVQYCRLFIIIYNLCE